MNNDERIIFTAKRILEDEFSCSVGDSACNGNFSLILRRLIEDENFRSAFMILSMLIMRDNPSLGVLMVLEAIK